ncbi:hypothetical protein DESUT3_34500 [Desulfuromonas versatilis]|uniref:Diguanylate cyclase with PAS/PAC sensor n=1 Tax=Desulfuromonas versatilis TaxID=2802975 RepID=A0ABM8HWJ5_9BACT|nr:diguanylate cyclase [Desulfuromonas versatilis]BCR06381.1 hypothetical protein DESUT3_34500 [Desulfuromonas versatilis]
MPALPKRFTTRQIKTHGAFALSTVLAIVLATLFLRHTLVKLSLQEAHTHQQQLARAIAHQFEGEIGHYLASLELVARSDTFSRLDHAKHIDPAIRGVDPALEPEKHRLLAGLIEPAGPFSAVFLMLPNGDNYLSHPFSTQRNLNQSNFADRPYFQAARETRSRVVTGGFLGASGNLAVVIDLPLLDEQGQLRAHLGGVFHLGRLSAILDESRRNEFDTGFLVDQTGHLIAHSNPEYLENGRSRNLADHPMLRPGADEKQGGGAPRTRTFTDPLSQKELLGTIVPLDWGWRLVLAKDLSGVYARNLPPILRISTLVALLLLGISGLGLATTWRIGRRWALADRALVESEARLKHIYDHSPVMMHSIDQQGQICNVNRKWLEVTGYQREEVIGRRADFLMNEESARRAFASVIPRMWKEGFVRDVPYRYIRKDGSEIDVLLNCDATIDPSGKPVSLSVVRDVTEQKEAEEELRRAKQELEIQVERRTAELRKTNEGLRQEIGERLRVEEKLRAAAITDELTGLLNRRGFFKMADHQLKVAQRAGRELLLCYCDLDGLKLINDLLGHATGDQAIIDAAEVLRRTFRQSDIIARLGGDEFVVLANETARDSEEALATRLHHHIDAHNRQHSRRFRLSLSFGSLLFDPENPCGIDELLARADRLMYQDKQNKKTEETDDCSSGKLF